MLRNKSSESNGSMTEHRKNVVFWTTPIEKKIQRSSPLNISAKAVSGISQQPCPLFLYNYTILTFF
jgi:hypothetical protein